MATVGFKALILNSHQTLFLLIGVKPKTTNKSLLLVNLFFLFWHKLHLYQKNLRRH